MPHLPILPGNCKICWRGINRKILISIGKFWTLLPTYAAMVTRRLLPTPTALINAKSISRPNWSWPKPTLNQLLQQSHQGKPKPCRPPQIGFVLTPNIKKFNLGIIRRRTARYWGKKLPRWIEWVFMSQVVKPLILHPFWWTPSPLKLRVSTNWLWWFPRLRAKPINWFWQRPIWRVSIGFLR